LNAGGLGWHGALAGGLIGAWMIGKWRGIRLRSLLALCAPLIPPIVFAGGLACAAARCGYGAEVDTLANHPAALVWEAPDVYGIVSPRYAAQRFGMFLALALVPFAWILRGERRFWGLLALAAVGMFAIGFARGDPVPIWADRRADQWLDLSLALVAAWRFTRSQASS
jgi:prolipoprotein diacylglyceryltransferase